jgi:hypothetical protein
MKVYQVVMFFRSDDDDPDRGLYQSPLFVRREDAEAFLAAVSGPGPKQWRTWSPYWGAEATAAQAAGIVEHDVITEWDGTVLVGDEYLTIV